jgi:hypothetical protein
VKLSKLREAVASTGALGQHGECFFFRTRVPPEPPRLTPGAARAVLRILLKARDREHEDVALQDGSEPGTGLPSDEDASTHGDRGSQEPEGGLR